jgi:hypothetical protein
MRSVIVNQPLAVALVELAGERRDGQRRGEL